ncbi:hypothetical protein N7456_012712 [Penicillium angulare]|uniref:SHSP domain-containing protein n=1 Tax=Penicillium angulare TaxID=116970 RepID=A0A9W9EKA9_9EURO|nr:hypothetical protein N7456_012712 [Penicillium angulare]
MTFLSTADLVPLFQLFDNCDDKAPHRTRSTQSRTVNFAPAFDVCEAGDHYYLDGELPGVNQDNIDIEFRDSYTLVVKGHTVRNYPTTESPHESSPRSRQPTVEDENDSASNDSDSESTASASSRKSTPVAESQYRYWASERSIGEFQRTFSFSSRVDQDAVRASLNNGILSIVIPKEATPKAKKIRIE